MYSYTERSGMTCTIVIRHVTGVFQKEASDIFLVYLDDSGEKPVEVPSKHYNDFMEKLREYITKRG